MKIKQKLFFSTIVWLMLFSLFTVPVSATEEENIDNFTVSPKSGRWNIINDEVTDTTENNILNITHIGDFPNNGRWRMGRNLKNTDSSAEIRFKVMSDGGITEDRDSFRFRLETITAGVSVGSTRINFFFNNIDDGTERFETGLEFVTVDGTLKTLEFTEDSDKILNNTWYVLKVKFDQARAKFEWELKDTNETRIWKKRWQDISIDERPGFFAGYGVNIDLILNIRSVGIRQEYSFDYIEASFKEHEWENVEVPVGFVGNAWDAARAEDDIDDQSRWQLNVPLLDSVSALMSIDYTNFANFIGGDGTIFVFRIQAVDADDGGLHELLEIQLRLQHSIPPSVAVGIRFSMTIDGVEEYSNLFNIADGDVPGVSFSASLSQDRSEFAVKARYLFNVLDSTGGYDDVSSNVAISGIADDPSQEFVLEFEHDLDFDGNIEMNTIVSDFAFTNRDVFTDIGLGIQGFLGPIILSLVSIFIPIFRFLASIFSLVGEAIVVGLSVALLAIVTAVGSVAGSINSVLSPLLTAISTAVADLAGGIWATFLGLVSDVSDFIDGVITNLVGSIAIMIAAVVGWLAEAADDFITNVVLPIIMGILNDLGITPILAFISGFITDLVGVLADIISLLTALFGWVFANATFWFNIDRLGALALILSASVFAWLALPFFRLFQAKDIADWDFDDIATLFTETGSALFKIFEFAFKILTYLFDVIMNILKVIGNYLPFT